MRAQQWFLRGTLGVLAVAAALGLTGCGPTGARLESLDAYQRDQSERDILPAELDEGIAASIDGSSSRYLAEHEGTEFYSAHGAGPDLDACLVSVGANPMAGCGSAMPVQVDLANGDGLYALAPSMPEGWTELADGLWYLASGTSSTAPTPTR